MTSAEGLLLAVSADRLVRMRSRLIVVYNDMGKKIGSKGIDKCLW